MYLLVAVHVMANLVWIGSIGCVGWLLSASSGSNSPAEAATLARASLAIYRRVANPAFMVSFLCGVGRVALNPGYYMTAHWFHGKLTFALVVIALHHVVGAKSKRAASGEVQGGGRGGILAAGLLVSAFLTVVFAIYKTALVP
jgi:putative membrane protein